MSWVTCINNYIALGQSLQAGVFAYECRLWRKFVLGSDVTPQIPQHECVFCIWMCVHASSVSPYTERASRRLYGTLTPPAADSCRMSNNAKPGCCLAYDLNPVSNIKESLAHTAQFLKVLSCHFFLPVPLRHNGFSSCDVCCVEGVLLAVT